MDNLLKEGGFGLYVHWPFCQSKCPYCDFNSHVASATDQSEWRAAFQSEIARVAELCPDKVLSSIFFGGGTPSLMEPETVETVITAAQRGWRWSNDIEITLEANPSSVEAQRFSQYANAGVNRVSLGLQALNDADLRKLGRLHTVREGLAALDVAQNAFDRVSFDLIYARQDQTLQQWEEELRRALSFGTQHLSAYQLTIEAGTVFGRRHDLGQLKGLPTEDLGADMYAMTTDICAENGMRAYEVSNYAVKGQESRHNLIYWTAGDYAGVGPGAHGRLTLDGKRYATETPLGPRDWLSAAQAGNGNSKFDAIPPNEVGLEYLMMGLRMTNGIDLNRYRDIAESDINVSNIKYLEDLDLITIDQDRLRTTLQGRAVLNTVLQELIR